MDYAASKNPSQRAAIISISGDTGPHLLPNSHMERDSLGPIFGKYCGHFKARKPQFIIHIIKFCVALTFYISSPKEQLYFNTLYAKRVLDFITLLHSLAKDASKSM